MWAGQLVVVAQFLFRYYALCRGRVLLVGVYAAVLAVVLLAIGSTILIALASGMGTNPPLKEIYAAVGLLPDADIALTVVLLPENTTAAGFIFLLQLLMTAAVYAVVIWCSVRMWSHLRTAFAMGANLSATRKTRQLAVQINIVLMVQAILPLLLDFTPTMMVTWLAATNHSDPYVIFYLEQLVNWSPLINGTAVICVVRPYRKAVTGMLKRTFPQVTGVSSQTVQSVSQM